MSAALRAAAARPPRAAGDGEAPGRLGALIPDAPDGAAGPVPAPPEGLLAFWLAAWARGAPAVVHAARSEARARRLARALAGLAPEAEVLVLPPWDCLPYDRASPSRAVMGERVATLRRLAAAPAGDGRPRVLLTTTEALLQRVPPREALRDAAFRLAVGDALDADALRAFLLGAGYVVDDRVDEAGEAAVRGAVVDLFPAASPRPHRLELGADGRIAALRSYDPLTQRTLDDAGELVLEPASELLVPADALAAWRGAQHQQGGGEAERPEAPAWLGLVLAGDAASPRRRGGSEQLLPLAHDRLETVLDLLPDGARLVLDPEHEERRQGFLDQVRDAHESRRSLARAAPAPTAVVLEPERLYLAPEEWDRAVAGRLTVALAPPDEGGGRAATPPRFAAAANPRAALVAFARERLAGGDRVVIAAGEAEAERARRLARLIAREAGAPLGEAAGWAEASREQAPLVLAAGLDLPGGFLAPGLAVATAAEVLGRSAPAGSGAGAAAAAAFLPTGFRLGDRVVHADHGVAVLRGLETVEEEQGVAAEHLALEYAGGDRLLVPALAMEKVWRYGSAESDVALDRVEGEAWRARRAEVEAQLGRAARKLADLAKARGGREAPRLAPPRERMARFAARFPFPETDDQAAAIEATLADLARGSPPMDRLVCGDVGFGKTEVALRAAAAAALSGRQVALLAPTTVLVRQHLQTFRRRFAGLGVRVEQLSRLARAAEAKAVRAGLADGSVRVVIGTHALASPDLRFEELGLVVIDEEQRFGTRQKAALRRLREGAVHVLTMSATPIPRTLQAALAGVQELSVIATPPVRRQPVRTHVLPFDPAVVREALLRERARGGRSFLVCPRVEDIEPMAKRLAEIVPELDVAVAHGRMKADALDDAVLAFADGRHDVLLATAIIETGLDIPGANTILIHRAERFGMAQLHQLRGRVGRGRERAAAYLLHDPDRPLPPATLRRLRALEAFEGLGAGFAISARDLDLRGAGDLVGEDQAGHLRVIGTELYQHLLERALLRARGEAVADDDWSPELRLGVGAVVPPAYVPEPELRLDLYARLARLVGPGEVDGLAEEIDDRFGPRPGEVDRLLELARLRLRCRAAGVARLEVGPKAAAATPRDGADAGGRLAGLDGPLRWSNGRVVLARETAGPEERLAAAAELLAGVEAAVGGGARR